MSRARVLVAPREIAGVAAGLQSGLSEEGLAVDLFLRWPHPFGYPARGPGGLLGLLHRLAREPFDGPVSSVRKLLSLAARVVAAVLVPLRYSTVVYLGPETLVRGGWDRRWCALWRRRTVTVFLGSDARPPYLDGAFARGDTPAELAEVRRRTSLHHERVRAAERDSTYVVNQPGTGQFQTRAYVDWTLLGFPSATQPATAPRAVAPGRPPVVLHAPSDPAMKGTDRIRAAVEALTAAGVPLTYVEVSGRPHHEVLAAIRNADLVVDQLYSDVLLPGLALESARLGTPVIVMGYAGDVVHPVARRAGLPTAHYAVPAELEATLRRLLGDPERRRALGAELQHAVVDGPWSPRRVAQRWARLVTGEPDDAWFDQPDEMPYGHGCAIAEPRLAGFLAAYLGSYGTGGLELGHAPRTEAAVLAVARPGAVDGTVSAGRDAR